MKKYMVEFKAGDERGNVLMHVDGEVDERIAAMHICEGTGEEDVEILSIQEWM